MRFAVRRALGLLALLALVALGVQACGSEDSSSTKSGPVARQVHTVLAQPVPPQASNGPLVNSNPPLPLAVKLEDISDPVVVDFKKPPRSGLLFDLDTGRVLWRHDPTRVLPIASLTKMMTSLLVARYVPEGAKVRITKQAEAEPGSRVGVLKLGTRVGVTAMLNGLLIISGNDTAVALAQKVAGSVPAFVKMMNAQAQAMHLGCTQFASPDGLNDKGHSCAVDLAALARAVLDQPRLAAIVKRSSVVLKAPVKGGKLYMYSHDPLIKAHYPGTLGVKTGFTDAAGFCFVGAAERGGKRVGVILLHSPDETTQAQQLLNRAWAALGVA